MNHEVLFGQSGKHDFLYSLLGTKAVIKSRSVPYFFVSAHCILAG